MGHDLLDLARHAAPVEGSLRRLALHCRQAGAKRLRRKPQRSLPRRVLNEHVLRGVPMGRRISKAWLIGHNGHRPHTGLGGATPKEFAARSQRDHD
jgi:hypothetical protein